MSPFRLRPAQADVMVKMEGAAPFCRARAEVATNKVSRSDPQILVKSLILKSGMRPNFNKPIVPTMVSSTRTAQMYVTITLRKQAASSR